MEWTKDPLYINTYYTTEKFNGYQYNVLVITEETDKSVKYWVHTSSGKKRKEFEIFEDKENKSLGGIRALFWIKEAMYDFPIFYSSRISSKDKRNRYLYIGWSDSRRKKIYQRYLEKDGFILMRDNNYNILMKKL